MERVRQRFNDELAGLIRMARRIDKILKQARDAGYIDDSGAVVRSPAAICSGSIDRRRNAMSEFRFNIGDRVTISASGESGLVVGRAEYESGVVSFLVRYKAGDGRAVEVWWNDSALVS